MNDDCFQLKGSAVTAIILEIHRCDFKRFATQLADKINQAPALFKQSPVVISLEKLEQPCKAAHLQTLTQLCRQAGLQPMAFRAAPELAAAVASTKLPLLPLNGTRASAAEALTASPAATPVTDAAPGAATAPAPETVVKTVIEEKLVSRSSKVITRPVRSGQQVYAEGDLIILAPVSEGAEVLASGNIHVYGPLRGRALAGVKGDLGARIFCQSLEAELVSIAGNFKLSDALRGDHWRQGAQIVLEDELLNIIALA